MTTINKNVCVITAKRVRMHDCYDTLEIVVKYKKWQVVLSHWFRNGKVNVLTRHDNKEFNSGLRNPHYPHFKQLLEIAMGEHARRQANKEFKVEKDFGIYKLGEAPTLKNAWWSNQTYERETVREIIR